MSYDADRTVAEMDYAGVDWALLHRTPYLGIDNDFFADCCRQHPERLQGLAYVREWKIPGDPDGAIRELDRAVNALGLHGLQFLPYFSVLHGITEDWDRGRYQPFWEAVADLRIPVFFTFISQQEKTVEGYLAQLRRLRRWMERYPDVDAVLTHGFDWLRFLSTTVSCACPDAVYEAAPCDNPRFRVQILFAVFLGVVFDYPMLQFKPTLAQMIERLGPERILWGTDVPNPYALHHLSAVARSDSAVLPGPPRRGRHGLRPRPQHGPPHGSRACLIALAPTSSPRYRG